PSIGGFAGQWLALGEWPSGPAWFVWLLLAFDGAVAFLSWRWPRWVPTVPSTLRRSAALFALALTAVSALVFLPLLLGAAPLHWVAFAPFQFQTSRLGLYALYFRAGVALGAVGIERGFLDPRGSVARRWPVWVLLAALAFVVLGALSTVAA